MASKLNLEIDFEPPRLIFDDFADLIDEQMKKERAADIAKKFNRERKAVYLWRSGCGFHCDLDFVCGLNRLGYDLKLVKLSQDTEPDSAVKGAGMAARRLYNGLLDEIKKDAPTEQEIIKMRSTFEEASNELNQVCCTLELLLTCLYDSDEETPHREALSLLWRNLLVIRDRMVGTAADTDVWSAALKAQKRLENWEPMFTGGF